MGVYKGSPIRGSIGRVDPDSLDQIDYIEFQFNPSSLKRSKGVGWTLQIPPGGYLPIPMFGASEAHTITFELLLYSREPEYNRNGVLHQLGFLESLVAPQYELFSDLVTYPREGSGYRAPPVCLLKFGPRQWYIVVQRMEITEEQFDMNLVPIRATVSITAAAIFLSTAHEDAVMETILLDALQADNLFSDQPTPQEAAGSITVEKA